MRYQIVLDAVAKIISNPGNLPSLGTATDGTAVVTDSVAFDAKTALVALKGFAGETLTGTPMRAAQSFVDNRPPYIPPSRYGPLRKPAEWAITQTAPVNPYAIQLLKDFQVYDYMTCLSDGCPGWFGFGCEASVPRGCCYVAHHCGTYVWGLARRNEGLVRIHTDSDGYRHRRPKQPARNRHGRSASIAGRNSILRPSTQLILRQLLRTQIIQLSMDISQEPWGAATNRLQRSPFRIVWTTPSRCS